MANQGTGPNGSYPGTNIGWWSPDLEDHERFANLFSQLAALRALQSSRIANGLLYEATYEQRNVFSSDLGAGSVFPSLGSGQWSARGEVNFLTYNAMQIGFDTLTSKLTQADTEVKFLTKNGRWIDRQKAQQLEYLVSGEFYRLDFYEVKQEICLDMLLHGRGYLKVWHDPVTKEPMMERWHPLDVYFDELEARDAPPVTMYTTKLVTKDSLKAAFPGEKYAEMIDRSQFSGDSQIYTTRGLNVIDTVEVVEAWRLPSAPDAGDGLRIIAVPAGTLYCGEWARNEFPFATMDWTKRRRGPYPIPAAEQIIFLQRNLNRLIQREHECIYTLSAPYLLLDDNSGVDPDHLTTDVGNIIRGNFAGATPPQVVTNKVVPDDIKQAIAALKQDIFDILGVVGLESLGDKPAGVNSAPAMNAYTESSSVRHVKTLKENERFVMRAAKMLLETIKDLKEDYGDYVAFGQGRDIVCEVKFSEADLPPNAYRMQMAPANLLPQTPAGRLQMVQTIAGMGVTTPKETLRLLQSPDIEAITNDATAAIKDIEFIIYEMSRENGKFIPPTQQQDLKTGISKVNAAYLNASHHDDVPDEVLERLDRWMTQAQLLLQQQQDAVQQQQMMMQAQADAAAQASKAQTPGQPAPQTPNPGATPTQGQ